MSQNFSTASIAARRILRELESIKKNNNPLIYSINMESYKCTFILRVMFLISLILII